MKYSISYDVKGGTAVAPASCELAKGSIFSVPPYSGIKNGYVFGGWSDGVNTYVAGSTYTVDSTDVVLSAIWNRSSYDYEVIGMPNSPNIHLPAATVPKSGYVQPITIKYSNDAIDPLAEIISKEVLIDGNSNYTYVYPLNATHPSGTNYVELSLSGSSSLPSPSLLELRIVMATDTGLNTFSIYMPSKGYWLGSIDSTSSIESTVSCIKEETEQGEFQVGINGITTVDSIDFTAAGVSLTTVSDAYAYNAGFVILSGSVDWTIATPGLYPITVFSEAKEIRFVLEIRKAVLVDSTEYDYEFTGVTYYDRAVVEWDIDSKASVLIKVQIPQMESDLRVSASCSDYDDLTNIVEVNVKESSVSEKYVVLELNNKSLIAKNTLAVSFGSIGKLIVNVVQSNSGSQYSDAYALGCSAMQVNANTHLDITITKSDSAPLLDNAKLLVIAKYDGGIVINVYTTPVLANGCGTDVIEVSTLKLKEVIIELVDGFQQSNPIFYGYCVYQSGGATSH